MNVAVIGTGYVGLATGVGLASLGNMVVMVGRDVEKVRMINSGASPIYEPGLEDDLKEAIQKGTLRCTQDLRAALEGAEVTFICVGTPSRPDGSMDLGQIRGVSEDIGHTMAGISGYKVFVVKSTVVPATTEKAVIPGIEAASGKKAGGDFGVCMNPEFLREGIAMEDFRKPDRIIIGELDKKSGDALSRLYSGFHCPILRTDLRTAEMIKYASNAYLATKISFTNEIGNICQLLGIDVYRVMEGVGMDHRISKHFLQAGCGFGGSCFPKDVSAIVAMAKGMGYNPNLLQEVLDLNGRQKTKIVGELEKRLGSLGDRRIAVLGLSFKADTDDIREAPSIDIIRMLIGKGAKVAAYDPKATENMKAVFGGIEYAESASGALKGSDACLILSEWKEFKDLVGSDFSIMKGNLIIEGRRVLDRGNVDGFSGVCW